MVGSFGVSRKNNNVVPDPVLPVEYYSDLDVSDIESNTESNASDLIDLADFLTHLAQESQKLVQVAETDLPQADYATHEYKVPERCEDFCS